MINVGDGSRAQWPVLVVTFAVLSGCAAYRPRPLGDQSPLAKGLDSLRVRAAGLRHGPAESRRIDVSDGLDLTEVGILAVLNNPELKVQRARLQVAGAQAFSAGLLPDPQISAGVDKPTGDTTGLVNGWLLGLGYDIVPLITRQARIDAERKGQDQVRLDLLWQEWQVIQRARSLAVRLQLEEQRLTLLRRMRTLYQERYQRSARALTEGNVSLDVNGTDLTALVDTFSQIDQLERTRNRTGHSLKLLLGLNPEAKLRISPLSQDPPLSAEVVKARLRSLPSVRPDLLALKAGYQSQEARVRAAILAQFPSLGIGVNRARDTGDVQSLGLSVDLSVPLFSGNRGKIAVERATREQLRAEYRARFARANVEVDRLLKLRAILRRQQDNLQTYLPRLKTLVDRARRAYRQGDIGALTFLNMESTWVNKRLEEIRLLETAWENRIALEALLALPDYSETPLRSAPGGEEAAP